MILYAFLLVPNKLIHHKCQTNNLYCSIGELQRNITLYFNYGFECRYDEKHWGNYISFSSADTAYRFLLNSNSYQGTIKKREKQTWCISWYTKNGSFTWSKDSYYEAVINPNWYVEIGDKIVKYDFTTHTPIDSEWEPYYFLKNYSQNIEWQKQKYKFNNNQRVWIDYQEDNYELRNWDQPLLFSFDWNQEIKWWVLYIFVQNWSIKLTIDNTTYNNITEIVLNNDQSQKIIVQDYVKNWSDEQENIVIGISPLNDLSIIDFHWTINL